MVFFRRAAVWLPLFAQLTFANLLGPRYPPPRDLTSEASLVSRAWQNLSATFDAHMNRSSYVKFLTGAENVTFSAGLFSIHDAKAKDFQYHYTSEEIRTAGNGTNKVNGTSIYRFASVSKLFTVYAAMAVLTDQQLNMPFSKIWPELAQFQKEHADDPNNRTLYTPWDHVTPLMLASHMSGVIGNSPPFALVDKWSQYEAAAAADPDIPSPMSWGLPLYEGKDLLFSSICPLGDASCTGEQYVQESADSIPTFEPWASPSYSNHGLMLLGIVTAKLTGRTLDQVYQDVIFTPLGMTSSYSIDPVDQIDRCVIPNGNPAIFFFDSGIAKASGGMFSTVDDLAKFSTSILNSTLMSPERTRRWMKPIAHSANPYFSVGAPWEIHRVEHSNGVVTDLYTKLGDSGPNGGAAVLIPEYGAGFNLVVEDNTDGGRLRSGIQGLIFDFIVKNVLPALEAQAAAEASKSFAGTYTSKDSNLNSTIALVHKPEVPGLVITKWISNSSDVLANQVAVFGTLGGLRVLPTIVDKNAGQYAFRVVKINDPILDANIKRVGPLTWQSEVNWDWAVAGQFTYAGTPLNLLYFEVDKAGTASALALPAWKAKLQKNTYSCVSAAVIRAVGGEDVKDCV